jgi:hypothetical protein
MHGTAWPDPDDQPPEPGRILYEHLPIVGSDPWLVSRTSSRAPDPIDRFDVGRPVSMVPRSGPAGAIILIPPDERRGDRHAD